MHVLRRLGERFVALHQRHRQLEAEQRLRTGQHHPRLGEHLDDLVLELHLASFLLGRRAVPEHQRDAVPEARRHGEGGDAERDGHGRPSRPSEVVEVEPQRHGEREERQPHYVQGEPKQREGVLASLHQTVSRGGKQGQPHHSEKEREAGELQVLVQARQPVEGRLEERAVLESEQHLDAEHQDARLVERVLHLRAHGHRNTLPESLAQVNLHPSRRSRPPDALSRARNARACARWVRSARPCGVLPTFTT